MLQKLFPNLSTSTSIIACIIFLAIGSGIYFYNVQMFLSIFKFERLSGNSGLYEKTIGKIAKVTIRMYQASSNKCLSSYYELSMNYKFNVDGKSYLGDKEFTQTYDMIETAIKKCQQLYPDQVIHLIIKQDFARKTPPDFDVYHTYLRFLKFDYKPNQTFSQIKILYNKINPKENCLESETKISDLFQLILWVLIITFAGSSIFAYFIHSDVFWRKLLIAAAVFLTAVIPGYFIKPSFESTQISDTKDETILYDIIVDQNNSEKYLKEQLYQQKMKHQNDLTNMTQLPKSSP